MPNKCCFLSQEEMNDCLHKVAGIRPEQWRLEIKESTNKKSIPPEPELFYLHYFHLASPITNNNILSAVPQK